jgi:hypothetical protein
MEDGKRAFTDSYGHFTIFNVTPGRHVLSVDKGTIPPNLSSEDSSIRELYVKEGGSADVTFVFYAIRALSGKVYIDADENGQFDKGEGLKDVRIIVKEKVFVTDDKGSFIIRNLPAGKIILSIDTASLPEGRIAEKDIIEFQLDKGQDIREDVYIRIIRKP